MIALIVDNPEGLNTKLWSDMCRQTGLDQHETVVFAYGVPSGEMYQELKELKPELVFTMGRKSTYFMTFKDPIQKWRGTFLKGLLWPDAFTDPLQPSARYDVPVMPTMCPYKAYTSEYLNRYLIGIDIRRGLAHLRGEFDDISNKRNLRINPTFEQVISYLKTAKKLPAIGFDIETLRFDPNKKGIEKYAMDCFSVAQSATDAMCIALTRGLYPNGRNVYTPEQEVIIMDYLQALLEDVTVEKWGQNIIFDRVYMLRIYGIDTFPIQDTMLMQCLAMPDFRRGLDTIGSIWTSQPYYKADGKMYIKALGDSQEQWWMYSALDSAVVMEAVPRMLEHLDQLDNMKVYKKNIKLMDQLTFACVRGIPVDVEGLYEENWKAAFEMFDLKREFNEVADQHLGTLRKLAEKKRRMYLQRRKESNDHKRQLRKMIKEHEKQGIQADHLEETLENAKANHTQLTKDIKENEKRLEFYEEINIGSNDQLIFYFQKILGMKWGRKTEGGKPAMDDNILLDIQRKRKKGYQEAGIARRYAKLSKLRGTYYDMELDDDGRFRCSWNVAGTPTGRLSSSQTIFGTGNNMQNQPYAMKPYLLFDEGHAGYMMDLGQAENRVVAAYGGVTKMLHAFRNGVDIHATTALGTAHELGYTDVTIEQIIAEDKADVPCPIGGGDRTWRYWGKKENHALNYDMSAPQFAREVELDTPVARKLWMAYHNMYPEVKSQYHVKIDRLLRETQIIPGIWGRRRRFQKKFDRQQAKDAYADYAQNAVSGIINFRGIDYLADHCPTTEFLAQVHDSIVLQIPLDLGWEHHADVLNGLKAYVELPLDFDGESIVIPLDMEIGTSWGHKTELDSNVITTAMLEQGWAKLQETQK